MKLAPHVLDPTPEALDWCRNAASIKIVTPNAIDCFRAAPAGCELVYRKYWDNQNTWANGADVAREVLNELATFRAERPNARIVIEMLNECGKGAYKEQTRQINEAASVCKAAGVGLIGPCWSTGDYDEAEWRYLIDNTRGNLDGIAVHAYWAGAGYSRWNALRFADYWRAGDPDVYVTECGRDVVRDGPNGTMIGQGGWMKDGLTPDQYLAELLAYNAKLEALPYVRRAYVFTAGKHADQSWGAYTTDLLNTTQLHSTPQSAPPNAANPTGGDTVTQDEIERWAADVWKRAGVPYNKASAFARYWLDSARRGQYLGRPEGPEFRSENGQYAIQEFAGAVLNCKVGEWIVREGLPFA